MSTCEYKLTQHPLALLFPCPDVVTKNKIKSSILKNKGVNDDTLIITLNGQVVLGWEEYSACAEFKLPFVSKEFDGDQAKLVDFLLSEYKFQLSKHHRALIGAYLKNIYRSQSKANQSAAGKKASNIFPFHAREAAAKRVQVSSLMVSRAEAIINSGNESLITFTRNGLISISCGAEIARFDEKKKEEFFNELNAVKKSEKKDCIYAWTTRSSEKELELEEKIRFIEKYYKEKRQFFNADIRQRLKLADTPEEREQIKQEINDWRKNHNHLRQIKIEQAKQEYEDAASLAISKYWADIDRITKIAVTEIVHKYISHEAKYAAYMRWNYEMGVISLLAVAEKISRSDSATGSYLMLSGRRVHKDEVIAMFNTMGNAELFCKEVNDQKFCHQYRVLKANSRSKRLFDYVGKKFMESVTQFTEDKSASQ